ncbi:MAG: hypothetical protein P8I29_03990 [Flavobacteriales bacterium]|nr:hypothetical protein [Flavobacteriales bacterium]
MKKIILVSFLLFSITFCLSSCGVTEPCPNYSKVSTSQKDIS